MILKQRLSDFVVAEAMILPTLLGDVNSNETKFYYYILEKCGFTTFEAVENISKFLNINKNCIGYAGLKDEDGITRQYISLDYCPNSSLISKLNTNFFQNLSYFINLHPANCGPTPIEIGELSGNNFKVIVRKITKKLATALFQRKNYSTFFINYYGPQRFGLPNGKKNTHLIGEYLLNCNYTEAWQLLKEQQNYVGNLANNCKDPTEFFNKLEVRLQAFYQSAFYSHLWNENLKEIVKLTSKNVIQDYLIDNIYYYFLNNNKKKLGILQNTPSLDYIRVNPSATGFDKLAFSRATLLQINIRCTRCFVDELNNGHWAAELLFFLPSGCYATIAVPQVLSSFCYENNIPTELL